jgi:hypothetical protein
MPSLSLTMIRSSPQRLQVSFLDVDVLGTSMVMGFLSLCRDFTSHIIIAAKDATAMTISKTTMTIIFNI